LPVTPAPSNANEFIEQQLDAQIEALEDHFKANGIAINGPLIQGVDNIVRSVIEERKQEAPDKKRLICILTTDGGYIEVVPRIVDVFRQHYEHVDFIVPDYAYSAGTVLVMSGDAIWMDYYSRLGPIDPQIGRRGGTLLPALGYLERYNDLIRKAAKGKASMAEVQLLIKGFDQAELFKYEQARELSITLLKEWLVKYKFKDWKKTKTRKMPVTKGMKTKRATEIARQLNNTKKWHAHGHGISRDVLIRDLRLKIDDFGADEALNNKIRCYYALQDDYVKKLSNPGIIHAKGNFTPFFY